MQEKSFFQNKAFRFRRFTRAGYAVFNSLRKVVNIGCTASYIADKQLRKSASPLVVLLLTLLQPVMAQEEDPADNVLLQPISISASPAVSLASADAVAVFRKADIESLAVATLGDLLEQLPGIDLRSRGGNDIQGDLTMRGGTFDQMAILINGINLSDPQTGHHTLDIPLDLSIVDRIELIPASALPRYGLTSFCGAVNIVTVGTSTPRSMAQLSGGSYGQLSASAFLRRSFSGWICSSSASYHHSQGHIPNTDYSKANLHLQAYRVANAGSWLLQLGAQSKDFGSQAFYSLAYPDQFESTRTLLATAIHQQSLPHGELQVVAYGRLHSDRFELFRKGYVPAPSWYTGHNYHLSSVAGARVRASFPWSLGRTSLGSELRHDGVLSTVLGDSLQHLITVPGSPGESYSLGVHRATLVAFLDHALSLGSLSLNGGLQLSANTMGDHNYGFVFGLSRPLGRHTTVLLSLGRSFRLPTFNDLYYHSVTQVNNPNLKAESSLNADASLRFHKHAWHAFADIYARRGNNVIDWVRQPESSVWYSMNHAQVSALGLDLQCAYLGHQCLERASVSYSFCTMSQQADDYISRYVLEYLRNKFSAHLTLHPLPRLRVKLLADYHMREGSYSDAQGHLVHYAPVLLLHSALEYRLSHFALFLQGHNLLNSQYCEYAGVPQQGLSLMVGLRYDRVPK